MQSTGYSQLKKTERIQTFYCSSQCCASGTCDNDAMRQLELGKNKESKNLKLSPYMFDKLRKDRLS